MGGGSIRGHLLTSFGILIISWERFNALSRVQSEKIEKCFLYYSVDLRVSYILMFVLYRPLKTKILKILMRQFQRIWRLTAHYQVGP